VILSEHLLKLNDALRELAIHDAHKHAAEEPTDRGNRALWDTYRRSRELAMGKRMANTGRQIERIARTVAEMDIDLPLVWRIEVLPQDCEQFALTLEPAQIGECAIALCIRQKSMGSLQASA